MAGRSRPGRRHHQRAGTRFGEGNQVTHRFGRHRRMHRQRVIETRDQRHRREITHRIVADLRIDHRADRQRHRAADIERITVGRRLRRHLGADGRTGATAIIDHDLHAEILAELLRNHARHEVGAAGRRPRHDQSHWFRGIILRGCAGGQYGAAQRDYKRRDFDDRHCSHSGFTPAILTTLATRSYSA